MFKIAIKNRITNKQNQNDNSQRRHKVYSLPINEENNTAIEIKPIQQLYYISKLTKKHWRF